MSLVSFRIGRCIAVASFLIGCLPNPAIAADWQKLTAPAEQLPQPTSLDANLTIELVAAEPDLVTPISCRVDSQGRLLVVESHTHFPPESYEGPPHDRVRILRDSNGDGSLDEIATFFEGTQKTMGMAIASDGWVYLATRASVIRIRDTDGDDYADQVESLLQLETEADYPHNGLSGLLLDEAEKTLLIGMGENLGGDYILRDREGKTLRGGGEGGNLFRCNINGTGLSWVATGFWNPFGLCRDRSGRVLMVGNDADARPPCRISEVVPLGDYGYQFRFGRSGRHPLQAWNGELPGTLPYVVGTGEAPCAILPVGPHYWVTSWGDNRIERYRPRPRGASIGAEQDVALVGGPNFRPVDMAMAPDGTIYVTDWVDRSYNVHKQGRVWRIRHRELPQSVILPLSDQERSARATSTLSESQLQDRLTTADPFLWQWTIAELAQRRSFVDSDWQHLANPASRMAWLMIQRWRDRTGELDPATRSEILTKAVSDSDEKVRLSAVRWAVERRETKLLPKLLADLEAGRLTPQMLGVLSAAVSFIEAGEVKRSGRLYFDDLTAQRLIRIATDPGYPELLRATALQWVPPEHPKWNAKQLTQIALQSKGKLQREAVRHLVVAADGKPSFRKAALELSQRDVVSPESRQDIVTLLRQPSPENQEAWPAPQALDRWMERVGSGGDVDLGWQVFFGKAANCSACHRFQGRGGSIGPDLTAIGKSMDRRKVLQSILEPSREMAPMYVPFTIETLDGRVHLGLKTQGGGQSNTFLGADGKEFELPLAQITLQQPSQKSIMPEQLYRELSVRQLQSLLELLTSQQ